VRQETSNGYASPTGAEFFGTFWLTFAGCGSAVLAAGFPALGIGFLGVGLAFGLTVLTMAYAVGHISGGHFNYKRLTPEAIGMSMRSIEIRANWTETAQYDTRRLSSAVAFAANRQE
jgi:aquaporin Z